MKQSTLYGALASGAVVVAGLVAAVPGAAAASHGYAAPREVPTVRACPANPRPGFATCFGPLAIDAVATGVVVVVAVVVAVVAAGSVETGSVAAGAVAGG